MFPPAVFVVSAVPVSRLLSAPVYCFFLSSQWSDVWAEASLVLSYFISQDILGNRMVARQVDQHSFCDIVEWNVHGYCSCGVSLPRCSAVDEKDRRASCSEI